MNDDISRAKSGIQSVREGDLTDMQMGILTTIDRAPGKVSLGGWPAGKIGEEMTKAFAPMMMGGLFYVREDKTLELSEEGEAALAKYRAQEDRDVFERSQRTLHGERKPHWHHCQACDGRGYHPAGLYMGYPLEDDSCVCAGGKFLCVEECREKDWDGPVDENGVFLEK